MRRVVLGLILVSMLSANGIAHGANGVLPGWDAVKALKPGTKLVVKVEFAPWDYREQTPCWVMSVDEESLTCSPIGKRRQRIVYSAGQVYTVYQVRMRPTAWSWARTVLLAAGGLLIGCAITDDKCDYPLGAMGAVAGGLLGAEHMSTLVVVYRRMEPSADGAVSP
jgi:hypothetical protein